LPVRDTRADKVGPDTIIVVGHARLPQSLSPVEASVILVELEIQREDGLITDLYVSGSLPGAARLLTGLLAGKSIDRDFGAALHDFQRRYVGPPQKAIATALSSAHESYQCYLRQSGLGAYFSSRARPLDEGLR
jgi:hypothetical protein